MSRTFRHRHMPMVTNSRWGGRARKIIDGRGFNHHRRNEIIEAETAKLFGPRPEIPCRWIKASGLYSAKWTPGEYKWIEWFGKKEMICVKPSQTIMVKGRLFIAAAVFEWGRLRDLVDANYVWPVSGYHPLARYSTGANVKWYRTNGNRWNRRRTKQILHSVMLDDDWDGFFPHKHERFDWWDLY